jgi:quinol monooxygenase YgiN
MLIEHVFIHVKTDKIDAFKAVTLDHANNAVKETGIARFDVIQQANDPGRFVLVEVYRTADAPARHIKTAHYQKWRDTVADMMAEPRIQLEYSNVFPDENGWDFKASR